MTVGLAVAGDDASGPIHYKTDLGQSFTVYAMSESDNAWSASLVDKLKYTGPVVHFVRTTLPLQVNGKTVKGAIYQAIEKPDYFYVVNGDAMLQIDTKWAYSPGVGGFSMHAPASRNFIVCLNLMGASHFSQAPRCERAKSSWKGHEWNRFKCCTPASSQFRTAIPD